MYNSNLKCKVTGKRMYDTRELANKAIVAMNRVVRDGCSLQIAKCDSCHKFHLRHSDRSKAKLKETQNAYSTK